MFPGWCRVSAILNVTYLDVEVLIDLNHMPEEEYVLHKASKLPHIPQITKQCSILRRHLWLRRRIELSLRRGSLVARHRDGVVRKEVVERYVQFDPKSSSCAGNIRSLSRSQMKKESRPGGGVSFEGGGGHASRCSTSRGRATSSSVGTFTWPSGGSGLAQAWLEPQIGSSTGSDSVTRHVADTRGVNAMHPNYLNLTGL